MKGAILLGVGISLALVGCGHKTERAAVPPLPTATVRAQTVESKKRVATEEVVGTVRAKLRSVIEAKVSGRIEQMLVVPGQQVKAGEILAVIDAREVQARYDQAMALRQQAEADLKRLSSLLEQKILSQAEFDNAQAKARVAIAGVTEAETMRTGSLSPSVSLPTTASGTSASSRRVRESSMSNKGLPGAARSPTSACLRVMTPANGAVTLV
jgi:multidrug efflux pump subunit AcrA (membrane-fusion protein)